MSYASFHYQLGKDFHSLKAHGAGGVTTAYAFHPLIRTRSSNLIVQFAYETKKLDDRAEQAGTIEDRKITASRLGVVGDLRDGLFGGGLNSYTYTWTEGEVFISPFGVLQADQAAAGRKTLGKFSKYNFEFRRLQKITDNITLLLALQGQKASKNLASAEKFSLGGATGVRAYPTGEALGDTGHLFQGELRYLVPGFKIAGGDLTLSTFYDQGFVRINENKQTTDTANSRNLAGYGFGASVGRDSDFIVRASAAYRSENEAPQADTANRTPRVWVQMIKWF
jgi:hemolysin activation/secretion protein